MKQIYWIYVVLILVCGSFFRMYKLDLAPPHLSNDEISIAYDAYSVARTGMDEHKNKWPIAFQSHNTYKAPLYAYILAPLTKIIPNTETSARLPSAILGVGTFLIFALVVFKLTGNKIMGAIGLGLLALNPWHIYTSRMALESNVALFCLATGILLWIRKYRFWATLVLALSIYGYHTEWVLTPLILGGLVWIDKDKFKNLKYVVILGLMCLPIGINFLNNLGTTARANTEMVWNNPSLRGKPLPIVSGIISNYAEYWNLNYLFGNGLQILPGNNIYQPGLFLFGELIFFIVGMFFIKKYIKKEYLNFVIFWVLVSPMVPAMTNGGTNLVRNLATVLPITLIIGIGVYEILSNNKRLGKIMMLILLVNFGYFWMIYINHFPIQSGINYQYGYKQMAQAIKPNESGLSKIVVETRFGENKMYVGVPHLYFSYFNNIDPQLMLERKNIRYGLQIGKYEFREVDWSNEQVVPKTIYAVPVSNLPPESAGLRVYRNIMQTDGIEAFRVYKSD